MGVLNDPDDEVGLQAHVATGDRSAFDELCRRHQHRLMGMICKKVGNAADAEEIVQDAVLRAWAARANYNPARSWRAWVFAIANHRAIDLLRKRTGQAPSDTAQLADGRPTAEESAMFHEFEKALDDCLKQLPLDWYKALETKVLGEVTDEIATRSGKSRKAIYMIIFKARKQVLDCLKRKKMMGDDQ